ncbi:diguanylate cyclase [Vibrio maritimus]|uniref:Diguanylate cyclase n=1 Tax=Vibrio maritimus TaxID=990268 RepID=A0A090T000_9VIBR|nr:diguanylate cyclase [Vibrio maritimus]
MGVDHFLSFALDKPLLAKHIILELTETAIANDDLCTQKMLSELREHGYQIAIDDFGTGYSALSCLDQFPFDYIKIDKHFIDRVFESVTDEIIIDATVAIARCMDVKVVAEGIENHAQAVRLIEMGQIICRVTKLVDRSTKITFDSIYSVTKDAAGNITRQDISNITSIDPLTS